MTNLIAICKEMIWLIASHEWGFYLVADCFIEAMDPFTHISGDLESQFLCLVFNIPFCFLFGTRITFTQTPMIISGYK